MVVAYLRGLLKPSLNYGLRSIVAENYVFESLMADNQALMLESASLCDASILPALLSYVADPAEGNFLSPPLTQMNFDFST